MDPLVPSLTRFCLDGGTCHHGCVGEIPLKGRLYCWRRDIGGCVPLSSSGLRDDWTPSPAGAVITKPMVDAAVRMYRYLAGADPDVVCEAILREALKVAPQSAPATFRWSEHTAELPALAQVKAKILRARATELKHQALNMQGHDDAKAIDIATDAAHMDDAAKLLLQVNEATGVLTR